MAGDSCPGQHSSKSAISFQEIQRTKEYVKQHHADAISKIQILWISGKLQKKQPSFFFFSLKKCRGFPGGAVVESLPAGAGDMALSPGLGGSHMPRSGWARVPQLLSLRVWSLCSATREAAIVRGPRTATRSGPRLPQLEKALAQKRRPNTAKNKKN